MNGLTQCLGFLRRYMSIRKSRDRLFELLKFPLLKRMEFTYKLLRLENAVNETVAVTVTENADRRIRHAVDGHELKFSNFSLILVQLAEGTCRKTNFSAVLDKRKKQITFWRTLNTIFRGGCQYTALADPGLVVLPDVEDADARVVRVDLRNFRMLELAESAAGLDHLLVEPVDLLLQELVRITAPVVVLRFGLGVNPLEHVHRWTSVLLVSGLRQELDAPEITYVVYKLSHCRPFIKF